jgi:uncharacterized protein YecE (DUF72 family)
MLGFYARHFLSVEINNTFYRPPTAQLLGTWAGQVRADFRFVLKAPQEITHKRRLKDCGELVASLVGAAGALKERFGPLLFQLPPFLKKDAAGLRAFLKEIPLRTRAAFEFRHASWFDDEVFGLLRDHNSALCIADADDDLEVPFVATADWGYLRLRRVSYDTAALKDWAARMRGENWREVFVFFKHEDAGTGPQLATRLLGLLSEAA